MTPEEQQDIIHRACLEKFKVWPRSVKDLETYNDEVRRGIRHTREWRDRMATIQADYDKAQALFRELT